jgi:hypothetical protein
MNNESVFTYPAVVRNGVKHQNDFSFYILKTGESETRNWEKMEK